MDKAILVAVKRQKEAEWEVEENLAELAELSRDAGIEVVDVVVQRKEKLEASTLIGSGKVEEVKERLGPDTMVIFDEELTPAQQGNLSERMNAPVIDRTMLILDIFAKRAQSSEGKIQVELAQLNYLMPRLAGQGKALSRLGGGIGTRGPGETKLESDRRRMRSRIADLQRELEEVRRVRLTHRKTRSKMDIPTVSLVGYTNAGKSSLLRALTEEDAYVASTMFATLDPTIRKWVLHEKRWVFLSDTVGFIRKLPHTVVAAFRATLEEVASADLLLHVMDASHPQLDKQKRAVEEVLQEIGAHQEVISVYNKKDLLKEDREWPLAVSALTGENLDELAHSVDAFFRRKNRVLRFFFPFSDFGSMQELKDKSVVLSEEFTSEGLQILAEVPEVLASKMQSFLVAE